MKLLWMVLTGCLVAGVTATVAADDKDTKDTKSNAALLVGTWEVTKGESLPVGSVLDISKDGKVKLTVKQGAKTFALDGTYKLDGKELTVKLKLPGVPENASKGETMEITKLTDTELVTVDKAKKTDTFKRKK